MTENGHKLVVNRISKSFTLRKPVPTRIQALVECSLSVGDQEIVALIGSSGCGKTTLLKIIHGLLKPDSGSIVVDGRRVSGPGHDRGMVFQHAALLPWRTALSNVEFGLEMKRTLPDERRAAANRFLKLVGLDGFENHHPHQLSGGMQQRIGLARALAINPEVLLMDEPFAALDAQTKESLQVELMRIHRATGKTIVFVTHDLDEAVFLADRVVVMAPRPGRVREVVPIDIPRPRLDPMEVKASEEFIRKRSYIWHSLKAAIADGQSEGEVWQ